MIPKVRFSRKRMFRIDAGEITGDYDPDTDIILVSIVYGWKKTISLIVHELVHWFQNHFTCRSEEIWNKDETEKIHESQADRVENFIYYTLLRGE